MICQLTICLACLALFARYTLKKPHSPELRDFLKNLLNPDPVGRFSAAGAI